MTAGSPCPYCHAPMESGFLTATNGSGLFWSHRAEASRLRPHDLEVLVPTAFSGMSSANLSAERCPACKKIVAAWT